MYDDRECDVFSFDKEKLVPIYRKFSNWILDYNRIQINRKFEKGLFNIYETSENMEKRLELNEKKCEGNRH